MSQPLISILLPVYNAQLFLANAINSVLAQTYTHFELLIINDGSTDDSERIILSYNDPRIRYIKNEHNLQLIATLNKGIAVAQGEYIARMDADDECMPTRLQKQVNYMQDNHNVAACGTYAKRVDISTNTITDWEYPARHNEMKCRLFWGSTIIHPTAMIRTTVLKHIMYNANYPHAEDYKLWKDISQHYELANIPEYLLNYTMHDRQITETQKASMNTTSFKINKEWLSELGVELPKEIEEHYKKYLYYDYTNWTNTNVKQLIAFLELLYTHNNSKNIFNTQLFAQQLAERIYFVIFNTNKTAYKGLGYYQHSVFETIVPITFTSKLKYYYKRFF
ncbi:MAG: glycosyltransferase family 2 protein [Bacteroidia bacterium]|nr:glycosyltransferase family 2 protein [Bacteroidia bacterium]